MAESSPPEDRVGIALARFAQAAHTYAWTMFYVGIGIGFVLAWLMFGLGCGRSI
jgi:hypothetical protein